jgi:hypothetical protein
MTEKKNKKNTDMTEGLDNLLTATGKAFNFL